MIVASHQPNFLPYMGYFYKMFMCDVFTLSDTVLFSNSGYHNYNFVDNRGERLKLTVPVSGRSRPLNLVELSQWDYSRNKLWKRLKGCYSTSPHFKELEVVFETLFGNDYQYMHELNTDLITAVCYLFDIRCKVVKESDLGITGDTPTAQIAEICRLTGCNTYLSGTGAMEYLDEPYLHSKGIGVLWSPYKPLEYGSLENLSVFDYLMKEGARIPTEWEAEKEALIHGRSNL